MNTKICVYCQQEFIPNTTRQIYCSKKCSKEAEKAKIRAKNEEKRPQGKICPKCGNTFIPKRYGSTRLYCFDCVPDGLSNGAQIRAIIKQWGLDYLGDNVFVADIINVQMLQIFIIKMILLKNLLFLTII